MIFLKAISMMSMLASAQDPVVSNEVVHVAVDCSDEDYNVPGVTIPVGWNYKGC